MAPQPPKIFLTGITGYLGGQLIVHLLRLSPTPIITALVRQESQAETIRATYPSLKLVIGGLDSHDLLVAESSKADIVVQAGNGDHEAGIMSITEGVAQATAAAASEGRPKPVLIQVSGSANLVNMEYLTGAADPKVWSDRDDMDAIQALPHTRIHTALEQKFQALAVEKGVQEIIVAPGIIFGRSASLCKQESFSAMLYEEMVKYGRVCVAGEGQNTWGWVSVKDTADALVFFVEEALKGQRGGESRLEYGKRGYYLVGSGQVPILERAKALAERLFRAGKIQSAEVESLAVEDLGGVSDHHLFAIMLRSNSRFQADRLKDLGWTPKEPDWRPLMEDDGGERM
ncbi:hypothetical protein MMC10_002863 [Thelotrema lepadinum]|nr:hypothetical protein [Thelotrema lepadinum]